MTDKPSPTVNCDGGPQQSLRCTCLEHLPWREEAAHRTPPGCEGAGLVGRKVTVERNGSLGRSKLRESRGSHRGFR